MKTVWRVALAAGVLFGCGVEDYSNSLIGTVDAAYEVPPSRVILDPDGGVIGAGPGPGGGATPGGSGGGTTGDPDDPGGGSGGGGSGSEGGGTMSCNVQKQGCPTGQGCYPSVFAEGKENGGICVKQGMKAYGDMCRVAGECHAGLVCSPEGQCAFLCDPEGPPVCPDGGKCTPLLRYRRSGYCS